MFNGEASHCRDGEAFDGAKLGLFEYTTITLFPSPISVFTGLLMDFMFLFLSHCGLSFPAVGTDNYTRYPTEKWGSEECRS